VSKNKNGLPGLPSLSTKRHSGLGSAPGLFSSGESQRGGTLHERTGGSSHASGFGASNIAKGISFGNPPAEKTTSAAGTDWLKVVNQAANDGIASLTGGGLNLLGLGSVVGTIASLFSAHQKSLPTLTPFQMGPSQNEAITVSGGSITTSTQSIQDQSASIAQAVKTAVLHSSTLNDVLSEI
jgi:hypothetical protein